MSRDRNETREATKLEALLVDHEASDTFLADFFELGTDNASKGLPDAFKPTSAFRLIIERLEYAREVKAPLALVTGAHGAGKSTALRYYARQRQLAMWECRPSYHEKYLMRDIARYLGVGGDAGWEVQTSIIGDQLAESPRMILLDEAQRLNYAGMDLLKHLADRSGSTFALAASPSLEKRIDRWSDISSRCTVRARVLTIPIEEFINLYQTEGFEPDTLIELHRLSKGVLRTLHALLREIDVQLGFYSLKASREVTRGDLQPAHLRTMAARVVGQ